MVDIDETPGPGDTVARLCMATTAGSAKSGKSGLSLLFFDSSTLLSSCSTAAAASVVVEIVGRALLLGN